MWNVHRRCTVSGQTAAKARAIAGSESVKITFGARNMVPQAYHQGASNLGTD
jgi:hypothetical protein